MEAWEGTAGQRRTAVREEAKALREIPEMRQERVVVAGR
jgi:hypothetical protein